VTNPADPVQEACDLLAGYLPRLEAEAAEPSAEGPAPGMHGRPAAAPLPGNPPALYALTAIRASARQLEGILKYAAGARRPGLLAVRGDSDANTLKALDAICNLIAIAGDDLYRIVISELEQRLNEARQVRAIDEAEQWRYVRGRACPYCGCYFIKVLLDAAGRPSGQAKCHAVGCADRNGYRPVATMGTDGHGIPVLAWADGLTELVADLEG
jgi:hypothetical protein